MNKQRPLVVLLLLCSVCSIPSRAQTPAPEEQHKAFFVTPFYQFTHFKELKLTSHITHYKLYEGEYSTTASQKGIDEYNDNFGTEYRNSMTGVRIGYQLWQGLGVSAYVGADHYAFKSWVSKENQDNRSSDYPALTGGVSVDYQTAIYDRFAAMGLFSYNYAKSDAVGANNDAGEKISSARFTSMYWEANLVVGYRFDQFIPYAGVGYTELYVNSVHEEEILTTDNLGEDFTNRTEFDSKFKGKSLYGFAGMEYLVNPSLSIYARSSFMNPLRATLGFKIKL